MASVANRIKFLYENDGLLQAEFCDKIGAKYSGVNRLINKDSKPSYDLTIKILEAYPHLSSKWLLQGAGEMWEDGRMVNSNNGNVNISNTHSRNVINDVRYDCEQRVHDLERMNSELLKQLETLRKVIDKL